MQKCGLTLNDKCEFGQRSVKFLGHIIDENGVRADFDKVNDIVNVPAPKNVTNVRRFLGMANQLGKFSPQLADPSSPLRDLLRKDIMFVWGHKHEAFLALKRLCSSTESLCFYDFRKEIIVSADASSYGGTPTLNSAISLEIDAILFYNCACTWQSLSYS